MKLQCILNGNFPIDKQIITACTQDLYKRSNHFTWSHIKAQESFRDITLKSNAIKKNYEHYRNGIYRLKTHGEALAKGAYYLQWDHLHNDVEIYSKSLKHLGSLDPETLKLYKDAVFTRKLKLS